MKYKDFYNLLDEESKMRLNLLLFNSVAIISEFYMIINILKISYINDNKIPIFIVPYVIMFLTSSLNIDVEYENFKKRLTLKGDFYE